MKFLGIDQSYSGTGVVLIEGDMVIGFDKFTSDKTKDIFERCWDVVSQIRQYIKDNNPDCVSIEGLAFGMTGNATRDLAGLQFSIITTAKYIDGVNIDIITPLSLKKFATGNGKAKKDDMMAAIPADILDMFKARGYKKTTGLADLTDAYFLAKFIQHNHK
jgi:Holliday junction resolvasome RuvABC endonuclease subunit